MSTMSSAGCPAASMALRTSGMRLVTPVEVSLCTTHTALMACALSSFSFASTAAGSAPRRQSVVINSTCKPSLPAIFCHKLAKCPVSTISSLSPGEQQFTSAASQAPVPDAG